MRKRAHDRRERDIFSAARGKFEEMIGWLKGHDAPVTEAAMEEGLFERGMELLRQLLEAQLRVLFERERADLAGDKPAGMVVRARRRQLESRFGRVVLWRHGHTRAGDATRFPLDERLELPATLYSYPMRECVAEEARMGAFDQVVREIGRTTAGHVPKRQAEKIAVAVAKDFDDFYAQRQPPANDTLSEDALLCASSDGKGIRMLPKALREATRKEWEQQQAELVRGDPMAQKKARQHDKRMATVIAVWEQEPQTRSAGDIVVELRRKPASKRGQRRRPKRTLPRPQNKRVAASVEKNQAAAIADLFDEVDRRDPERKRELVVLVDGAETQQSNVYDEGRQRGRALKLVLDLIHVIHYLWLAGWALCRHDAKRCEVWTLRFLKKLLTGQVEHVIADIRRAALARNLNARERRPVDKCLSYFERNLAHMRYREFLAAGLPIATGIIEGACRHLIQDRLGITGARWDLAGAEAILRIRALHTSGDWKHYWRFHQRREVQRNYAVAA